MSCAICPGNPGGAIDVDPDIDYCYIKSDTRSTFDQIQCPAGSHLAKIPSQERYKAVLKAMSNKRWFLFCSH